MLTIQRKQELLAQVDQLEGVEPADAIKILAGITKELLEHAPGSEPGKTEHAAAVEKLRER